MDLASDPFGATSVEDQDWLDRNGYPNELQWTTYQSSPDEALEQAAEAGDTAAAGLLGFRKMLAGDESAYAALLESAALGDDFALELLTSYMFRNPRGPTSIPVDPKFGMALNRVMEWRGNYSAASARNAMYRDDFSTVEWIEIDAQAQQILGSFNELYRETHGPLANPVDPRPTGG